MAYKIQQGMPHMSSVQLISNTRNMCVTRKCYVRCAMQRLDHYITLMYRLNEDVFYQSKEKNS